jgi:Zn-finger nucleic acid-binding protein
MSVEELACPKCGGPIPIEDAGRRTTCRFCAATVVPKVLATKDSQPTGPQCPRCAKPLVDVRSAAKVVRVCERCGGVWVDNETAGYLARVSDPDLETAVRRSIGMVVSLGSAARQASVACPVCEKQTTRIDIPGTVNAVDRCDDHGTWFDRDELELFVQSHRDARAGEVAQSDVPMQEGFFSRAFNALSALTK